MMLSSWCFVTPTLLVIISWLVSIKVTVAEFVDLNAQWFEYISFNIML